MNDITLTNMRPPLHAFSERLNEHGQGTSRIARPRPDAEIPFQNEYDFQERGLEYVDVPVRRYQVEDCETVIVVPEEYAAQLDQVRRLRISAEGNVPSGTPGEIDPCLLQRVLPEEIIPLIKAMPDPSMIQEVFLLNQNSADDIWHRQILKNLQFESSFSAVDGRITLFKCDWSRYLFDDLARAWALCVSQVDQWHVRVFGLASEMESHGFNGSTQTSVKNQWAHDYGEGLLSANQFLFTDFALRQPIRATVLGLALRNSLESANPPSTLHAEWQSRLEHIETEIRPVGIEKLVQMVSDNAGQTSGNVAAKLLVYLGEAARLNNIPQLTMLNLAGESLGNPFLAGLSGNKHLKSLDLRGLRYLSDFSFLATLPNLEILNLAGTRARNSSMEHLKQVQVRELNLSYTEIEEGALVCLYENTNLQVVNLSNTKIDPAYIHMLQERRRNLKIIF